MKKMMTVICALFLCTSLPAIGVAEPTCSAAKKKLSRLEKKKTKKEQGFERKLKQFDLKITSQNELVSGVCTPDEGKDPEPTPTPETKGN